MLCDSSASRRCLERVGEKGEKIIRTLRTAKSEGEPYVKLTVALGNILKLPTERVDTDAAIAAALPKAKEAENLYEDAIAKSKDLQNVAREIGIAKTNLQELQKLGIGTTNADIATKTLDDKAVKISDYRGKVVVLQVGASTSPSILAMIPHLRGLVRRMEEMPWTHWFAGKGGPLQRAST